MKYLLALLLLAGTVGCTDAEHTTALLKQQGYRNIQTTGYSLFACSQDDMYHTGFRATTRDNVVVTGTVCKGMLFKSATIRFD